MDQSLLHRQTARQAVQEGQAHVKEEENHPPADFHQEDPLHAHQKYRQRKRKNV